LEGDSNILKVLYFVKDVMLPVKSVDGFGGGDEEIGCLGEGFF
jgi:hypothetical protein